MLDAGFSMGREDSFHSNFVLAFLHLAAIEMNGVFDDRRTNTIQRIERQRSKFFRRIDSSDANRSLPFERTFGWDVVIVIGSTNRRFDTRVRFAMFSIGFGKFCHRHVIEFVVEREKTVHRESRWR